MMVQPSSNSTPSVLLVEDDEHDVVLLQAGSARLGLPLRLWIARNGQEAVDYFVGQPLPNQAGAPARPDLVLLDITMPRLNGFEVLQWLRERPEFRALPVVILSYSTLGSDQQTAQILGATDYRIKPRTEEGMMHLLEDLYSRYLSLKATDGAQPPAQLQPPATA